MGDFNDILSNEDKRSHVDHPPWRIRGFREAVQDCNLVDLPLRGYQYTWGKGRDNTGGTEERLDRAMVTEAWFDLFPQATLTNLIADRSDHSPILLQLTDRVKSIVKKQFKFENIWLEEKDIKVVLKGWTYREEGGILKRLRQSTKELKKWSLNIKRKFSKAIDDCRQEMEALRNRQDDEARKKYEEVRNRMTSILAQEDAYWKQRAKVNWLKDGDTNSKKIHAMASVCRKQNHIVKLKGSDGEVVENHFDICGVAKKYFDEIFTANEGSAQEIIEKVQPTITEEDNQNILKPFTMEEFRRALFQMHSDKAPEPDGLNPTFYKHFWHLCGFEIFYTGVMWLGYGEFPSSLVETNIVLIPKKENPKFMKDLRPISLCNVLYKIISKVLANIMKNVLSECISQEQSAFVENRYILDNVLVVSEILHHMRCKTKGKRGEVALKIDISKAYDRVNWSFVQAMMLKLGFQEKWVNWMGMCMSNLKYQVLINGDAVGLQNLGRGLRQGDPLSPYLFIICVEGLSVLLKRLEAHGDIHGVKVCRGAPLLTHLLFADDCFLFYRAEEQETRKLLEALKTYEEASGQVINLQKSEIFFSRNTEVGVREVVKRIFQVTESIGSGKYLGLLSFIGRRKKAVFSYIRDRIWNRIQSWTGKHLSKAGREVKVEKHKKGGLNCLFKNCFFLLKKHCSQDQSLKEIRV